MKFAVVVLIAVVAFAILCNESSAEETDVAGAKAPGTGEVKLSESSGEHGKGGKGKGKGGKGRGKGGRKGDNGEEGGKHKSKGGRKGKHGGKGKSDKESSE